VTRIARKSVPIASVFAVVPSLTNLLSRESHEKSPPRSPLRNLHTAKSVIATERRNFRALYTADLLSQTICCVALQISLARIPARRSDAANFYANFAHSENSGARPQKFRRSSPRNELQLSLTLSHWNVQHQRETREFHAAESRKIADEAWTIARDARQGRRGRNEERNRAADVPRRLLVNSSR